MPYPPNGYPFADGQTIHSAHVNDTVAELGTNPSGTASTVTIRLSQIEQRIGSGGGVAGPRGPGVFASTKSPTDPTFDPIADIIGYPPEGLIDGDLIIGPDGKLYVSNT